MEVVVVEGGVVAVGMGWGMRGYKVAREMVFWGVAENEQCRIRLKC